MTEDTKVLPDAGDNSIQQVVSPEQAQDSAAETNDQNQWSDKKHGTSEFIWKLKSKLDEKDAEIASLKASDSEKEARIAAIEKREEENVAVAKFGEEAVKNPDVQAYKEKYPGMSYEEAIRLAGVNPQVPAGYYTSPGRAPGSLVTEKKTITGKELQTIADSNPQVYERDYRPRILSWELQVV